MKNSIFKKISIFLCAIIVLVSIASWSKEDTQAYSTGSIVDQAWENFDGIVSSQIGETDSTIYINTTDADSKTSLVDFLKDNLSEQDKQHYKIVITIVPPHLVESPVGEENTK